MNEQRHSRQDDHSSAILTALRIISASRPGQDIRAYKEQLCLALLSAEVDREWYIEQLKEAHLWPIR